MANKKSRPILTGERAPILLLLIGGVIILVGALYIWKQFIYSTPQNTFWGMVEANLQTRGVTKHVKQEDASGSAEQYLQLELGANNAARAWAVIQQDAPDGSNEVVTETIGTPTENYLRYERIKTTQTRDNGSDIDFTTVQNVWGRDDLGGTPGGQSIFSEVIYGAVPFGRLTPSQRQELITYMQAIRVYDPDFTSVQRVVHDGKEAHEYNVSVRPEAYILMLKKFDQLMGLNQLGQLDASQYKGSPPIRLKMIVAVDSRALLQVNYVDANRQENYSAYGAHANIQVPEHIISRQELEQNLNQILQQ